MVVIILLLCVIIITLAFLVLVVCYLSQRDKCRVRTPIFSLDKQMSYNSLTNLISHKSSSTPDSKAMMGSPVNTIKGMLVFTGVYCILIFMNLHLWISFWPYQHCIHMTKFTFIGLVCILVYIYIYIYKNWSGIFLILLVSLNTIFSI